MLNQKDFDSVYTFLGKELKLFTATSLLAILTTKKCRFANLTIYVGKVDQYPNMTKYLPGTSKLSSRVVETAMKGQIF